jgi:acetyltransferase
VLRVETIAEVFDLVEVLGKQPRPRGPRLTIVTNAGGPAALAADCAVTAGLKLAELSDKTLTSLGRHLPPHWSRGNPIDILGDADPDRYARALNAAAADPECDGVLAILTPQAMTDAAGVAWTRRRLSTKRS